MGLEGFALRDEIVGLCFAIVIAAYSIGVSAECAA